MTKSKTESVKIKRWKETERRGKRHETQDA